MNSSTSDAAWERARTRARAIARYAEDPAAGADVARAVGWTLPALRRAKRRLDRAGGDIAVLLDRPRTGGQGVGRLDPAVEALIRAGLAADHGIARIRRDIAAAGHTPPSIGSIRARMRSRISPEQEVPEAIDLALRGFYVDADHVAREGLRGTDLERLRAQLNLALIASWAGEPIAARGWLVDAQTGLLDVPDAFVRARVAFVAALISAPEAARLVRGVRSSGDPVVQVMWRAARILLRSDTDQAQVHAVVQALRDRGMMWEAAWCAVRGLSGEEDALAVRVAIRRYGAASPLVRELRLRVRTELRGRSAAVLARIRAGEDVETIASALGSRPATVRGHLRRIYRVLGVRNRAEVLAREAAARTT